MIKLIIDTRTNTIFNTFEFSGTGAKADDYILGWTDTEGECILPEGFLIQEVDDFSITEMLPAKDGCRTEFRYDFATETVYELYIIEPYLVISKITELTNRLNSTDYKVIKAYEASLIGGAVPYNFNQVHAERQAIRDKINELEGLLNREELKGEY
ncbi:MAG: hypothetical protein LUH63_16900 [Parabacteroides sp.]|nr:hypothetical protein [Parabacteroides sp.]